MSIRWTKRPQNYCRECGYTWFPRGRNVSLFCPNCKSTETETALEGCFRALGYLLLLPLLAFVAIAKATLWLIALAIPVVRRGASTAASASEPARAVVGDLLGRILLRVRRAFGFAFRWLYSVKDDVLATEEREVNPVALVAKVLIILGLAQAMAIGIAMLIVRVKDMR